jgi:ribosomal protein L6P/L9E
MILVKQKFELKDFKEQPIIFNNYLKVFKYFYQFPLTFTSPILQLTKGKSKKKIGIFSTSYDFYTWLRNCIKTLNTGYHVDFILNSTSYKVELKTLNGADFLNLDLGFSHVVLIKLPVNTFVHIEKRRLILFSKDLWWLTNFINFFQGLRYPNAYTSKGILLKGQVIQLKPGKRRQ